MLIDASHPEETRVAVISGSRLEDFDYESTSRKQLKGNIYLAKVTRVEPSLQAAFVEYGGNRHGFLPFSEIHPDYYRIPIADREALIAAEAEIGTAEIADQIDASAPVDDNGNGNGDDNGDPESGIEDDSESPALDSRDAAPEAEPANDDAAADDPAGVNGEANDGADSEANGEAMAAERGAGKVARAGGKAGNGDAAAAGAVVEVPAETSVDTLGGDDVEDAARRRAKLLRRYKIQEVIKRRQVILVQVTKEERGNKGAALTTYLSLAGRYCVLMPNTAKGGGISRKIASAKDRRRLKSILEDLKIPEGIAVIVRTAGSERTKAEIRRDYEFLVRLWDEIRSTTLASTAPALIYEEANLIKRAIRDSYQSDSDEILVEGDEGYKAAKAFMRSLTPSHARKVKQYKDPAIPLFYRHQIESQIDAMHNPVVQLRSGGYIVLHMTEALVAIDVNSGKATRERHIEETAYKTNLEAAEEVARQLRLRDMAGLIVIDFIDMDESRHNRTVERKLKEAMRLDRARIQLGRISPFGLLELSRQRLRPSLLESSTEVCPYCNASGYVRTRQSVALHILRGLEEEGIRRGRGEITITAPREAALHLLNEMRDRVVGIEQRYGLRVWVTSDDDLIPPNFTLRRSAAAAGEAEEPAERRHAEPEAEAEDTDRGERKRGRGRRRRRKDAPESAPREHAAASRDSAENAARETVADSADDDAQDTAEDTAGDRTARNQDRAPAGAQGAANGAAASDDDKPRRRRRGKRGGRRRSRRQGEDGGDSLAQDTDAPGENAQSAEAAGTAAADSAGDVADRVETAAPEGGAKETDAEPPKRGRGRRRGGRRDQDRADMPESDAAATNAQATDARAPAVESTPKPTSRPAPEPAAAPRPDAGPEASPDTSPGAGTESPVSPVPGNGADDSPGEPPARRRGWWNRWT